MRRLILLAALCGACSSPSTAPSPTPTPVPSTAPSSIQILASTRPDLQLDVTAKVLTASGGFVASASVTFAVDSGTISPSTAVTDASGLAHAIATSAGKVNITATSGTLTTTVLAQSGASPLSATLFVPAVTLGTASSFGVIVSGLSPDATVTNYAWDFGDANTNQTTTPNASHLFASVGSYNATVKVTDSVGRSVTAGATAIVNPVPVPPPPPPPPPPAPVPIAVLGAVMTCTLQPHGTPTPCNVNVTYGNASLSATTVTEIDWDWGDGSAVQVVLNSPLGQHTYGQAGSYNLAITVTATTVDGQKTATTGKAIVIQ